MKTYMPKEAEVKREWLLVDATDLPTGRLAVIIADALRGRDKPTYTPHVDTGAFVIVTNCEKIKLSGNKNENKIYQDYSGYSSGRKERKASVVREKNPERIITQAVKGMLPNNRQSRQTIKRLKVYVGNEHPHSAQSISNLKVQL
ncbi:MAG: 50S ribosomal protein L13 [Verrucomicrobiota bacterium]|nr:50S ribosomal protein L13 [Verrucomicrobiota bacterium]MEC8313999.1 50S ribosomal protein L13 [Verrucomicrobiota bacterium]MEC8753125.1 50S ribosomal protein L13 [Verrucomicrobiota bacterium]|tara:strand:- start:167 stop:601 length:435 start_codon:yes stop_codon:yes gene_type:complete